MPDVATATNDNSADSFKTPSSVNWDANNLRIERQAFVAENGVINDNPELKDAGQQAALSFSVSTTFQGFDVAIRRDSITQILTQIGATVFNAAAYVGEHGVTGFVARLQALIDPVFFPIVASRHINTAVTLQRGQENGPNTLYLDINTTTTFSRQQQSGQAVWRVLTHVAPNSGPEEFRFVDDNHSSPTFTVHAFTALPKGGTESTVVTTELAVFLPSVVSTMPDLEPLVRDLLARAGLLEPGKPNEGNITPSMKPDGTTDPDWLVKLQQALDTLKATFANAIHAELASLSGERVVIQYNTFSDANILNLVKSQWLEWFREGRNSPESTTLPLWPPAVETPKTTTGKTSAGTGSAPPTSPADEKPDVTPKGSKPVPVVPPKLQKTDRLTLANPLAGWKYVISLEPESVEEKSLM